MSPRTKLLNNKALADKVRDMVDSEVFDTAADAAMLQYIESIPNVSTAEDHASAHNRVQGAIEFLRMFRRIADVPRAESRGLPANLDFKA